MEDKGDKIITIKWQIEKLYKKGVGIFFSESVRNRRGSRDDVIRIPTFHLY